MAGSAFTEDGSMPIDVYGVGNALVDIQAHVPDAFLAEIDYAKGLMTLVNGSTQREVLSRLSGTRVNRCAGGSAANTLVGVAQFGGRAAFAGKLADDELGRFFLEDLRRLGIRVEVPPVASPGSGTCVVLITPDAQRTMLTSLGAATTLTEQDIDEAEIKQSRYVYIEGYLFGGEPTRSAALRAIDLAKHHGVKVAFTASDPFLIQYHRDEFWRLIEGPVDLLFCNLEESRALTGRHDAIDCAREIHRHAGNVALTMGPDGSLLMHNGEVIPIEGVSVAAVDTTGAGDMYAAGILYGVTNGLSWKQAGRLASHAAARVVGQLGARLATPYSAVERDRIAGQ
jgi:sugar/nucleoside kinase (ribokinase family)